MKICRLFLFFMACGYAQSFTIVRSFVPSLRSTTSAHPTDPAGLSAVSNEDAEALVTVAQLFSQYAAPVAGAFVAAAGVVISYVWRFETLALKAESFDEVAKHVAVPSKLMSINSEQLKTTQAVLVMLTLLVLYVALRE
jgi:hypothetical protein